MPTQQLLQAMVRLSLRHEHELGMLRAETGFMLFLDAPSHHELSFLPRLQEIGADWTEKCAAGTVKSPLKDPAAHGHSQRAQNPPGGFSGRHGKAGESDDNWVDQSGLHANGPLTPVKPSSPSNFQVLCHIQTSNDSLNLN